MESSHRMPSNLGFDLLSALRELKPARSFPKGATLFQRGDPGEGIYLIDTGEVRVFLGGGRKQRQLLELAGPGSVLGLNECMASQNHRITAVANDETMAIFVPREEFLEFLQDRGNFRLQVISALSEGLHDLYHKFGSISAHPGRPRRRSLDEQLN